MTQNLKRKRAGDSESRKSRKVEPESDEHFSDVEEQGKDSASSIHSDNEEEGGEWNGLDGADNPTITPSHEPGTKPRKPPTGEELRAIKDATNLFRSSSFKLQIDALLPNVRPKDLRTPPLDRFLLALHSILTALPSIAPQHPLEASRKLLKRGVSVPYSAPLPTEDTNWKVAFEKPSDITVVGSWPLKTSVKAKDDFRFGVDIALEMPNELFQEKDYLNGRFFHKRAFYIATIAAALKSSKSGLNVEVQYDSQCDDPRLTKLVLIPNKDDSPTDFTKLHAQVCLIPVLSSRPPISLHRLSPSHSNLRINTQTSESASSNLPTPIYNTALLCATTPKIFLLSAHAVKEESPAFVDALTLLRVWANQRGYGPGSRVCVRGFADRGAWWSALLGFLIVGEERTATGKPSKRKPLGRGLSSYQLFRGALDFLSRHDFERDSIFVKTKEGAHKFPPEDYQQYHSSTFVDSSSTINLLAGVPLGSLQLLQHDALQTLETLDHLSLSADPFTDVFLTDHRDLATRFDTILRVDLSSAKPLKQSLHSNLDYGSPANALMASLSSSLLHGLGDRTKAVALLHAPSFARPLSQAHPSNASIIYVGLIHNPSNAFRLVDHGPAAEEEDTSKVEQFREFWGDKAELRRFKDGRIIESVVWDVKTADERAHVPGMIVRHVLQRHFGLESNAIQTWQGSFDSMLRLPESISSKYLSAGIPTGFKGALAAFDTLVKQIKNLDLPLSVLNISPISDQLRYTSVFSPVPLPSSLASIFPATAQYLAPIRLILEFEKSSRWPDDVRAIQKMKLAFFERIASELMASVEGLRASVVIGDGVHTSEIVDQASLEVVTPEGWAFCLSIWCDREAILLDRIVDEFKRPIPPAIKAMQGINDNKDPKQHREALEALDLYMRRFIHGPRHHRAVAALCHQYSAFAGTVRLVKRWLAAHWLLHSHVSEEAVELICANLFVGDGQNVGKDVNHEESKHDNTPSIPGSKERGFASVISFLKDWRWEEGLFVPIHGPRKTSEDTSTPTLTATSGGVWNIITDFDKKGRIWTSLGPDLVVAQRVKALAQATWRHLQGMEHENFNVQAMFIHPTSDYDLVVRLNTAQLPRYFHNVAIDPTALSRSGKYANLPETQCTAVRPGFDPACLLFDDLQRVYGHTFKIFHDVFGGDRFGIVWDPSLKGPRPFRVLGEFSSMPIKKEKEKAKDKGLVVLNENGILSEIERLGRSLVKEIIVHDSS